MAPAVELGLVPDATVRSTSDELHGPLVSLSHCSERAPCFCSLCWRNDGKHERYVGSACSSMSLRQMAMALTAWLTHDAPRARISGASPHPPSHTNAIEPANFFGFVVALHFSVLSPLGAFAMSATDSPLR